ncbi:MAG: sigma-70 family RNA polymerase sigma factor [Planctomycetaceae bacterium]|nr:sigma-70 family RNA polymerase sigma factor [Planctomycetaceae bacterium]
MRQDYHSQLLKELVNQRVAKSNKRQLLADAQRAEQLVHKLSPTADYTFDFISSTVSGVRDFNAGVETQSGRKWIADLLLLIEDLSDASDLHADSVGQPVHTVDELCKMHNVSSKTVSRWRQQGLVSRKFIFDGHRKRIGFLRSSVDAFVKANPEKIARGERFSHMSENDRNEIIEYARRLAGSGYSQSEVAKKVAREINRSAETIRYTIRDYDLENPKLAVFPDKSTPLSDSVKQKIYKEHGEGKTIGYLVRRYERSAATIYRVLGEIRAKGLLTLSLEYVDSLEFHSRNSEKKILADMPEPEVPTRRIKAPAGIPGYMASLYDVPLLTRDQEYHLFRKYNYLKFRASKLRETLDVSQPSAKLMDEIDSLYAEAVATKNQIVHANLRLVVSIAKRHLKSQEDFFQLISDGNMSLIRACEKFDYSRGNKFSTYASWSIIKNFGRTIPGEFKHRDRFRTAGEELFLATPDERADWHAQVADQKLLESQIEAMLHHLDDREQQIIIRRFGLNHQEEPLTLQEVGEIMGVTKERVRQIEVRALNKLKEAAALEKVELPEAV